MTKRTKEPPPPQTDAFVGRDLLSDYKRENEEMVDTLVEGETVQYYSEGWRVGKVEMLPDADEVKYGQVRILHAQTGRVWVPGRDVKKIQKSGRTQ
jgi:hypothetical protein